MVDLGSLMHAVSRRMTRKKHIDAEDTSTNLKRCLTLKRLTFIGVGKTVGVGIYVLIGVATKEMAGPAVIFSFLIAFLVILMNGLCFAEYASKNPKTGAQYTYMYNTVGEMMAFIIGWTGILSFISAFSMASRGWSGYIDALTDHAIQNYTVYHVANWTSLGPPFPEYPDFPAIFVVMVVMVISSIGVNFSTTINALLAASSGILLIFISICGAFYGNFDNWFRVKGGFFPYGFKGVLKASSACFYAFQGFEILGFSAEETVNPKKTIPRSIVLVLVVVTLLYLSVAISFTLMIPYTEINTSAPFPGAFNYNSVTWAKYIVAVGPMIALSNLCVLEMYTVSRLLYSMSADGLLFKFLSKVNKRTKVPLGPVLAVGPVVIGLVLSIDLSNLIGFMVIYAFIQYSIFAAYLIVLRYTPKSVTTSVDTSDANVSQMVEDRLIPEEADSDSENHTNQVNSLNMSKLKSDRNGSQNISSNKSKHDSELFCNRHFCMFLRQVVTVRRLVLIIYVSSFLLALQLVWGSEDVMSGNTIAMCSVTLLVGLIIIATAVVGCKEQNVDDRESKSFLVPLMPVLPVLSLFCNHVMLISAVDTGSFIASTVLVAIGMVIYFLIVTCDVVKKPELMIQPHTTVGELTGLLSDDAEENEDVEMEIYAVSEQVPVKEEI